MGAPACNGEASAARVSRIRRMSARPAANAREPLHPGTDKAGSPMPRQTAARCNARSRNSHRFRERLLCDGRSRRRPGADRDTRRAAPADRFMQHTIIESKELPIIHYYLEHNFQGSATLRTRQSLHTSHQEERCAKMDNNLSIVQLIYCSRATKFENRVEFERNLRSILDRSRAYNPLHDITGALVTDGEMFAHVAEGPATAVRALYSKIISDKRHENVITLQHTVVHVRLFNLWPMALIRVKSIPYVRALSAQSPLAELRKASVLIMKALRPVLFR